MIKKPRIKKILIAVIALVVIFSLYKLTQRNNKPLPTNIISVSTSPVLQKTATIVAHAIGVVQPYITVSVKSRVDGQLMEVGFKEGEVVKVGQPIFKIDPHPYQVALLQVQANLARDQAQLESLKKLSTRYEELVKKGFLAKRDYDQAHANLKAQVATIQFDKAAVANAQLNLDYCVIRAPINGRTGNFLMNLGNLVKANDANPLVIINQVQPIYIVFSLPEHQLAAVKKGALAGSIPVSIHSKSQKTELKAELSFIDNTVNAATGMIQLKALFPNKKEELWPGEYVDVTIPLETVQQALLIPTRAIQAGADGAFVFVVDQNSHVSMRAVKLGAVIGDETIIEGLKAGERVVVTGQSQLVEGSLVRTETGS